MMILLFAVIICLSLAGCSLQDKIGDYSREQCYLNKENVTQFSYKGNDYTILYTYVSSIESAILCHNGTFSLLLVNHSSLNLFIICTSLKFRCLNKFIECFSLDKSAITHPQYKWAGI